MHPFSLISQGQPRQPDGRSGHELIAFDAEKMNVFAAKVRYCEPHWHPAPELITVLSGRFSVISGEEDYLLTPGDMLYINAGEVHSLSCDDEAGSLVTVQFSPGLFDEMHPVPSLTYCTRARPLYAPDLDVYEQLRRLAEHLVLRTAPFLRIAALYTLLNALTNAGELLSRAGQSLRDEVMVKKAIAFIHQHADRPLAMSEVADHVGISYCWFSRLFKQVSRHNFKAYLTLVRMNKAKTLLRDTHTPITDVSQRCGFQQHKHLIAAFKKYCGVTPTEYRKRFFSASTSNSPLALAEDYICLPLNQALLSDFARVVQQRTAVIDGISNQSLSAP